jgi:RNA polymerase sigma-70 factor (ECF subfamily)
LVISESSPEAQIIHQEMLVQVLRGLARLSERDQEIISLKFAGRLRNKEIGQIMEMKEKTVSVVLLRAVRRLRLQIEEEAT